MGSAELSCASLRALVASPEFAVVGVVTQPDRPKGRELRLHASPVKELANSFDLAMLQPARARDERFIEELRAFDPELIVVAAYGQILPSRILDLPRYGCLNVHTSLLPKYRGAAPIQWAILNDEAETGVTIMKMDAGLDTGDVVSQEKTPISSVDTSETLHGRLAEIGAQLLVKTIPGFVTGTIHLRPQPGEGASYAPKIKKEDGRLDWKQPARALWNRVRGLIPWPGTFTYLDGVMLKIRRVEVFSACGEPGEILQAGKTGIIVACGCDSLKILELQREGGRRLAAHEFMAGYKLEGKRRFE